MSGGSPWKARPGHADPHHGLRSGARAQLDSLNNRSEGQQHEISLVDELNVERNCARVACTIEDGRCTARGTILRVWQSCFCRAGLTEDFTH